MACHPRFPLDDSWLFADPMTLAVHDDGEPVDEPWPAPWDEELDPDHAPTPMVAKSVCLSL